MVRITERFWMKYLEYYRISNTSCITKNFVDFGGFYNGDLWREGKGGTVEQDGKVHIFTGKSAKLKLIIFVTIISEDFFASRNVSICDDGHDGMPLKIRRGRPEFLLYYTRIV